MDNSDDKIQAPQVAPGAPGQAGAALSSRRRLLRGGLIGAPALLALKSSPVLACNCKKPSGFSVSGNLSRTGSKLCADPGKKPSVWKTNLTNAGRDKNNQTLYKYTGTSILTTARFKTYFTVRNSSDDISFAEALNKGNTDDRALIVAVYLESLVAQGSGFPISSMVVTMWNHGIASTAGYQPVSSHSLRWTKAEVVNYLKYLTAQA